MATISLTSSSSSPPSPPTITPVSSPPAPPTISSISSHRELLGPNPFVDNFPNDYSPPPPPTTPPGNNGRFSAKVIIHIAFVVPVVIGIIVLGVVAVVCFRRIRNSKKQNIKLQTTVEPKPEPVELFIGAHLFSPDPRTGGISNEETGGNSNETGGISNEESLEYDFATIQLITNNFSPKNKIGEGGYGSVYKGKLPRGQEVAIKRLSKSSRQGEKEFKNEVEVVAKLQHKSLVKLLGYCSKGEEKILIYEYVSNGSLDYFLFDSEKRRELDWSKRYEIIKGIARGLLYLHQDSRLTIIHRDLKTSNILLDVNMIPKIADFGTAKIFGIDQTHGCTSQIVGTHGYMSPEYVMHGEFSMKSDVFSFGVMLLEIISGKKNLNTCQRTNNRAQHLLSYAWEQWRDGRPLEILDPVLAESSYVKNKVIHCLHIGLLCVQEDADKRPTMAEVMSMFISYSSNNWSAPCVPAFYQSGREAAERNIGNRTV